MSHKGDEAYLEEAAADALGGGVEVLAAGIFGWEDLMGAQIAGGIVGGVAADAVAPSSGAAGDLAGAAGAAIGGHTAKEAMAEAHGMTWRCWPP